MISVNFQGCLALYYLSWLVWCESACSAIAAFVIHHASMLTSLQQESEADPVQTQQIPQTAAQRVTPSSGDSIIAPQWLNYLYKMFELSIKKYTAVLLWQQAQPTTKGRTV